MEGDRVLKSGIIFTVRVIKPLILTWNTVTEDKVLSVTYFKYFLGVKFREESSNGMLNGDFYVLMKYLLMAAEE